MQFVITGLPRSGLAWLANYFYKGESIVTHEGARFFLGDNRSMRQAHVKALHDLSGDCSSSWLLYPDLLRMVPRVVLIERERGDALRSFKVATEGLPGTPEQVFQTLVKGANDILGLHPLILPYEEAYGVRTVERICHHIREDFDLARLALLRNTRVTQDVHREYQRLSLS